MAGCTEVLETGQHVQVTWPKPGPNTVVAVGSKRVEKGHVAHADMRGASVMFPSGSYFWPKRKMANGSFYNTGGADVRILRPSKLDKPEKAEPSDLMEWDRIIRKQRSQS